MSGHRLAHRRVPAEETDAHRDLRAWLERMGYPTGDPIWLEIDYAIEDVDGLPIGVETQRIAGISNIPPDRKERR